MPFADCNGYRLYYELTGPEERPIIIQFGGSVLGRYNFSAVNDAFRKEFRLLSFDARGYGRSDAPAEPYSIEERADDGAALLDALGIERALIHGTSMGGMVAMAFTAKYPDKVIAACADCAMARCDLHRKVLFRTWRSMAEAMPLDEMADALTLQSVSPEFMETESGAGIFDDVREMVGRNTLHTIHQACIAMERMDLEQQVREIRRPILFTNGTKDIMTPPRLAPSGFSAAQIVEAVPDWARLYEFPDIGHACLLEVPDEAVAVVTSFFSEHLD